MPIPVDRTGSATWSGGLKTGRGSISTQSGVLEETPYGFGTRFESQAGTNPEELIGAAHAGCFTMQLAAMLENEGHPAESLETKATVRLDRDAGGFHIPSIRLTLSGRVPGLDEATFQRIAAKAKDICPVSKVLKAAQITLEAKLTGSGAAAGAG